MTAVAVSSADIAAYALRLGDDALVLAQRLSQLAARGPEIEEDMALTNMALDELGQARTLLSYAGELEGGGRDEDALAYLRTEREFSNALLVEQPNHDFAHVIVRQLLFATYQLALYERLTASSDELLAAVAGKAVKEVAYHRDHAEQWTLRLGDGTVESKDRMEVALSALWPFVDELFESDELTARLSGAGVGVDPPALRTGWEGFVHDTLARATLDVPESEWHPTGGRRGQHTEGFGFLLAEMQSLHRTYPGVQW
jgi:ring-1,2-phenylacetyl-CoA epoxidase subunit PaaC